MSLPTAEAYYKAIQDPANLALPVLRFMKLTRNVEDTGPYYGKGAFGIVFRFEKDDGAVVRAVKCFTKLHGARTDRYEAVAEHLDRVFFHNAPAARFLVNSIYTQRGIRVERRWCPLLLMDWVDGVFLHKHLAALCEWGAVKNIEALAKQWLELALALKEARIAHGDLQHGNVLVQPSGQMKLIDYDGMCVPSLANRHVMEGGHLNYQHPARSLHFDVNLDAFSALVILTALTALSLQPGLWNEFNHGNNLLFHESDFKAPEVSPIFRTLLQLKDPRLTHLVRELATACTTKQASSLKPFEEMVAPLPA